jgi:hypothetical protein
MSATRPRKRIVAAEDDGKIIASVQRKAGKETIAEKQKVEYIRTDNLPADPAYVSIGAGLTENLGNFESLRLDARVSLPCANDDASIKKAADRASKLVQEFIEQERRAALGQEGATDR